MQSIVSVKTKGKACFNAVPKSDYYNISINVADTALLYDTNNHITQITKPFHSTERTRRT